MNRHILRIAVMAASLSAAPMWSLAASPAVATDSCLKAFLASLSATMQRTPKLRESHFIDSGLNPASSEWTLTARDAKDNHTIARAACTVDASGKVIDLHPEPL